MVKITKLPKIIYVLSWVCFPGLYFIGLLLFGVDCPMAMYITSFIGGLLCLLLTVVTTIVALIKTAKETEEGRKGNVSNIVLSILSSLSILLVVFLFVQSTKM